MAVRKRSIRVEPSVEEGVEEVVERVDEGGVEGEDSFFDAMGDNDYVLLFRRDEGTKAHVFHGRLAPSEANEYFVSQKFGGGEFLAKERKSLPSGRKGFGRQRTIFIAGKYRNPVDVTEAPAAPQTATGTSPMDKLTGGVNMEDVKMAGVLSLLQMTQQAAQTQATMQQQVQQMMMSSMTAQREGMQAMVEMMAKRPDPAPAADPMAIVTAVLAMVKDNTTPKASTGIKDLVEGMQSILSFRDDLIPAAPITGNPLMDSVPKVLDLVQQGFDMKKLEQTGGKVSTPTKTTSTAPPAQEIEMPMWQRILLAQKASLVKAAMNGKDADIAAMAAVEFLPDGIRGAVEEFVRRPDMMEQVYVVIPEMRDYPNWTAQFFAAVRTQILPDDELVEEAVIEEEGSDVDQPEGS